MVMSGNSTHTAYSRRRLSELLIQDHARSGYLRTSALSEGRAKWMLEVACIAARSLLHTIHKQ